MKSKNPHTLTIPDPSIFELPGSTKMLLAEWAKTTTQTNDTELGTSKSADNYYPRLVKKVQEVFPSLTKAEVRYVANKITNRLRKLHQDILEVSVTDRRDQTTSRYCNHFKVTAVGVTAYVCVTVD